MVVEGSRLVRQALAAGWQLREQYVAGTTDPIDAPGEVHRLGPNVIDRTATTDTPPDVIGVLVAPHQAIPAGATFVLGADRLADPGNAGTMIRTAEAAGADAVVLTPGSVDPYNPKVVRATAGSLFRVPVVTGTLSELGDAGLTLVATSSHHGRPYTEVDLTGPVAVILGNEAHGLDDDAPVDHWVRIPQHGAVESLNVAMAATVLAYEVVRQRARH